MDSTPKTEVSNSSPSKMFDEIENKIKELDHKNEIIMTQHTNLLKEFPKTIKKEYNFLQGIEKLQDKFTNIKSLTDNALQNIERAKEKIEHLKQNEEKLDVKIKAVQKLIDNLDKTYSFLGFNFISKGDNLYTIQFSKLPIKNYDMTFTFDILTDINNNNNLKVIRVDPEDCIDNIEEIECQARCDDNSKFLKLILLLRQALIKKNKDI